MSHHDRTTISGEVTAIFAHRLVVETATGPVLADLGPEGAHQVRLAIGDRVELIGEMKPSELKVESVGRAGAQPIRIDHRRRPDHDEPETADPGAAVQTAEANGFTVLGRPRRKPRHFEILGRDAGGDLVELHLALDGTLRKTRPVEDADPKWQGELASNS